MGNSSNAYITKQPNPINPSDWINKQQEISNYYSEVERQREREELARKDKLRGEFNKDFDGEFDLSSMGNDVVNKVFTPLANQSLVDLKEAKDEGEKALNQYGINSKEYRNAKAKYDNVLQRPAMFKLLYEGASSRLNDYSTLVSEGKIYQTPDNLKKLQNITKTPIKFRKNELGEMVIQQGEEVYRLDEFADKLDLGKAIYKIDDTKLISDITATIGEKKFDELNGYKTTTTTNPWEDYKNPQTGERELGIKNILSKNLENALTDDVVESVLAERGQFGYDEMPPETKDELKAKILDEWLEVGRGQIEQGFGIKFDSSKYGTDAKLANEKRKENQEKGISFVEEKQYGNSKDATANIYAFNTPYEIKGTSKSERPKTLYEIRYDEQNGNIAILGKEYQGKNLGEAIENYEKAVDEQNKAYEAWVNEKDEDKARKLYSDYKAKTEEAKVSKTKTDVSKNPDEWKDVVINDKAKVTAILSKTMDIESYEEAQSKLKRQSEKEPDTESTKKPVYKGLDDDGNPILE